MLILGYKVRKDDEELEQALRYKICKYFDLRHGRQVFYETPDSEIVIIYAKRKPFVTFFEQHAMDPAFAPH